MTKMALESTMVCVDNSEFMRNGDFVPTRLHAQQEAVGLVCQSKTRANHENNIGLSTLSNPEVLSTLTNDVGRILSKLYQIQPNGTINFITGVRVAHLVLKHRQGKNHKMRIVMFVGSPVHEDEEELLKLAKRLKKEKVNVDIVIFGEDVSLPHEDNTASYLGKLTSFINAINGKEGTGSRIVTVPQGPNLSYVLLASPIIQEDGAPLEGQGFEYGVDPNDDPELAMALRISMEEQRQEIRLAGRPNINEGGQQPPRPITPMPTMANEESREEKLLDALSLECANNEDRAVSPIPNFANASEDEQLAYVMQLSMQQPSESSTSGEEAMEVESGEKDEDLSELLNDPEFQQNVLQRLSGVIFQSKSDNEDSGSETEDGKKIKKAKKEGRKKK